MVFVVFPVFSEGCGGLPVRCGVCAAIGACPVRGVGSRAFVCRWSACLGCLVARTGPAGRVWSLQLSLCRSFPVRDVFSRCAQFLDVRVCRCCVVGVTVIVTPSSAPSNGLLVLLLGRGGRVGSVLVVPVARGRYGTLWRCAAPSWRGVSSSEKSFEIRYHTPCPALEASSHAQFFTWYFAVSFGRPFHCACANHMYTSVRGKAPSVPLSASPCSRWEFQGAALAQWCGARAYVCLPVVRCIVPCLAGSVAGVSVLQCGVRSLGLLGSCSVVGMSRPARRAGLGVTLPCSPARAGGLSGPCGELLAPCLPLVGVRRKRILVSVEAPLSSLDAVNFLGYANVSLAPFPQVTCAETAPASQAFNSLRGGARRSQRRAYSLILVVEGKVLDHFFITFPWSSVWPWVLRVWLAPWPGPSCVRFVGEEG